jgi:hypothetical protein
VGTGLETHCLHAVAHGVCALLELGPRDLTSLVLKSDVCGFAPRQLPQRRRRRIVTRLRHGRSPAAR